MSDVEASKPTNALLYKTSLCVWFMNDHGACPFKSICTFAHGRYELRSLAFNRLKGDFALKIQQMPSWKTLPCGHFARHGACTDRDQCQFAHGEDERRVLVQTWYDGLPPCTFFANGNCKVGTSYGKYAYVIIIVSLCWK
jgi:hypothetical protein